MLPNTHLQVAITPGKRRVWARGPPISLCPPVVVSLPPWPWTNNDAFHSWGVSMRWIQHSSSVHLLCTCGLFPVWGCYKCNSWECSHTAYMGARSLLAGWHPGVELLDWMVLYWPTYFSFAYFELHVNKEYYVYSCALWRFTFIHGARCSSLLLFVAL